MSKKKTKFQEYYRISGNLPEGTAVDGAICLAHAIVLQAVKDHRSARVRLKKSPDNAAAQRRLLETEAFFRSQWFYFLSGLDGNHVLQRLLEEPV